MKKSYYSLYKEKKCVYCDQEDESFYHVWNCNQRIEDMNELISMHDEILLLEINEVLKEKKLPLISYGFWYDIQDIIWNTNI
jgi:hypothetical protein